jgi:hypothetical protein
VKISLKDLKETEKEYKKSLLKKNLKKINKE